jgi:GNAT superfamily N-acetyltransferase
MRFFTPRYRLTSDELRFFTHPDGITHFAIVALELDQNFDEKKGLGIARFIRDEKNPTIAEMAVTVIDEMQGRGIGQLLCRRISQAAIQRGLRKVQSLVLSENRKVINLIKKLYPRAHFRAESEMMLVEIDLDED